MANFRVDTLWPWLRVEPPENPVDPGVIAAGSGPNGFGLTPFGYDPSGQAAVPAGNGSEFGLANWRPPDTLSTFPGGEPQSGWSLPQRSDEEPRPDLKWPWLRVEPPDDLAGFGMASDGSAAAAPTATGNAFGLFDWRPQGAGLAEPFAGGLFAPFAGQPSGPSAETQPWWSLLPGQSQGLDGHLDPRWPWLRAEPTDEPPGFRMNPDGSVRQSGQGGDVRLMSSAYDLPGQAAPETIVANGTEPPAGEASAPLNRSQQAAGVDGLTATTMAVPMVEGMAGSQAGGAALSELAALAGRAAPGAASIAAAALPFLITPTNTQSETIDLGDGLRARVRPGQRSMEIERRADNGLFATGIGARWETLPVDAELHVGEDGATSVLINHRQLQEAVGPGAAAQAWDAIGSAMARPPKKREEGKSRPSASIEDDSNQAPAPGGGSKPPVVPSALGTAAEIGAKALEHAHGPQSDAKEQSELIENWRQLLKRRGELAPGGQYRGEGGIQTALGVKMPPDVGEPTAGREVFPEQEHLRKALIGEFELVNRIKAVRPDEIVLHYGNHPGARGPDVLSIGRDRVITGWDSKLRSAERSVGPSMAATPELDRVQVVDYVWKAINGGRLPREVGLEALKKLYDGNYNICTVGTGNAHDGLVEFVRNHKPSGPRRH